MQAAKIDGEVDSTPASGDMAGRLMFLTTESGSETPAERMRITNSGNVGINATSPMATWQWLAAFSAPPMLVLLLL